MEYLSRERYDQIASELDRLINVEYPRIKDDLAEARAQGDLSENAGYRAARRAQGKAISRINVRMTYTIVSPHEMDIDHGKISCKSPIGMALMGKKTGEQVEVQAPSGTFRLRIDNIIVEK